MGHTVIGVFKHSGDADLAAAHMREEYTLEASELDIIGQAEYDRLSRPGRDNTQLEAEQWSLALLTGIGLSPLPGDEDPIGKRWGDKVWNGETLVVVRLSDLERAHAAAADLRRSGAERVDLLPH